MKKRTFKDRQKMKKKTWYTGIAVTILFIILIGRLSYIMIIKGPEYAGMAEEQWTSEVKIDAVRGKILDRNGKELAVSANVYRVDLDLTTIRNYLEKKADELSQAEIEQRKSVGIPVPVGDSGITEKDIAPVIADALGMKTETVLEKLETKLDSGLPAGSATLIRRIEKDDADKVKNLKIRGIVVSKDTKRYYPNNNFLSHVLGVVGNDGTGLTGIESEYNTYLSGIPGVKIGEFDKNSNDLPYSDSEFTSPVNGKDVTLTIDETIQSFAEKAAQQAYEDNKAKATSVMVMDPKTGEILAMVNKPDFNPNTPYEGYEDFDGDNESDKIYKMWRNRLVSDSFEPGSIFKVITALSAMEEGIVNENTTFECGGKLHIANRDINCWETGGHGLQTFPEIIQNSCNVGFMKLGSMIGKDKFYEYIKKFGFGELTGIDIQGEADGIVKIPEKISPTDLATISFGHTNTVNSMQYMAAFNAVANGGTWIQPHIMKEVTHDDENGVEIVDETFNPVTREIASSENTALLRTYLEKVVTAGSATATFIDGYHIGGKTGTAQKMENGVYIEGKYISSFVGMAPVDDPKVTIMITVDEPSTGNYYAGQVAVPYAHDLFTNIFNYFNNQFSEDTITKISKDVVVPEIRGMKKADAENALKQSNIQCIIEGNGDTIQAMDPLPGYSVKEGTTIKLYTSGGTDDSNNVVMPDVIGYTKESAYNLLTSLGIPVTFQGDGTVKSQNISSGEVVTKGTSVNIVLESDYKD
ncbi:stage V sporulation protein D [uncultured Clostridium sp.]|uniref:stage V sporulation protein D n=1 Tax=uncultured Clostridium sp. TaxID=59620 RepID=UPI0025F688EC|nr:stage V sporulation protein D [uncultured Clostridium sp.]